jgi:hypothetical protein
MTTITTQEMWRIKAELFDNVLDFGAVPWLSVRAIYDVIQANVSGSSVAPTTSSTAVTVPGATVLTLASVAGLAAASRVVIDVDTAREVATVRAVSGSTISVVCTKLHAGTYPVEIESGLTIVRGILADLEAIDQQQRLAIPQAGVRRVDEIEFFGKADGGGARAQLEAHRNTLRGRLASATGLTGILRELAARASGGLNAFEAY